MNCRWSTVYTFPSSPSARNYCCDVTAVGQHREKAARLEIFIYWVKASWACTIERTPRGWKCKVHDLTLCRPRGEMPHRGKRLDASADQIENRNNLLLDFM